MLKSSPKTLLITGASGFLGWYLCQEAIRQGWRVHGVSYRHAIQGSEIIGHSLDLTHFKAIKEAIAQIRPDAVIHAAAQARPNLCEREPEIAYKINVEASLNLAGLCSDGRPVSTPAQVTQSSPIPYVFISTNQVFDGTQAPYHETDPVSPINIYGEQKVEAEEGVIARHPNAILCRMPLMFGNAPTAPSFLQGFLQRIEAGEPLNLFTDEFRTPVGGADAAKGILLALAKCTGRLHLGGIERLSRYDFGQILVDVLGVDPTCITACRQSDLKMAAARAPDLTMDSSRAIELGYAPMPVRLALRQLL